MTVVIQINGKRRGEIVVSKDTSEKEVEKEIQNIKNIKDALSGKNILKSIYVPNKILNLVVEKWTDTNEEDRKKLINSIRQSTKIYLRV